MSDETFRLIVAGTVILATIAVLSCLAILVAFYRITRQKLLLFMERAAPVFDKADRTLSTTIQLMNDLRPHVSELSAEAVEIAKSGRQQVEMVGDLVRDTSERVHARLEQADESLEHKIHEFEHTGHVLKKTVMRPIREVSGFKAGLLAAFSTLKRKCRSDLPDPKKRGPEDID